MRMILLEKSDRSSLNFVEDGIGVCGWQRGACARNERVSKPVVFELVDSWCFVMNYSILGGRRGDFPRAVLCRVDEWRGRREKGVEKAVTIVGEWKWRVLCDAQKRQRERKKTIDRKILKISGKKWLAKWCSIERRRKSILTKLSNYFKEEALPSIIPLSSFVPLSLSFSLSLTLGPEVSLLIDSEGVKNLESKSDKKVVANALISCARYSSQTSGT